MLEILSVSVLGVLIGAFTGIIPGIHPNTVIFGSLPFYITSGVEFTVYAAFIAGMSISHTFHDFLPTIYIQAPEAETALSTMPGAEKAANGKGPEAFYCTLLGGVLSIFVVVAALPLIWLMLEEVYTLIRPYMAFIVCFFLFFLIFRNKIVPGFITAVLAGFLGIIGLNSPAGNTFLLMPIFSGLFAVPAILSGMEQDFELPEQDIEAEFTGFKGGITGALAGFIAGTVPGVGAAGSTTFLSPLMDDREDFLAGMGAVNTTDITVSIIAVYLIGKARSGVSVALQSLSDPLESEIIMLAGLSVFCAGIAALTALRTQKAFLHVFSLINFKLIGISVLIALSAMSFVLAGGFGFLSLVVASFIGFYGLITGTRQCCMAVLLVPAILFFIQSF